MKKLFYLLIFIGLITGASLAVELQGGVSFDVKSARDYIQQDQVDNMEISGPLVFEKNNTVEKMVYSYNNNGQITGITVQYKGEPAKAYIYNKNNKLIYIDKYDKSVDVYPHRGYRYNLDGKLILTSLTVSKKEMFRFSPSGNLIAHSVNNIIYDENGNIIGHGK